MWTADIGQIPSMPQGEGRPLTVDTERVSLLKALMSIIVTIIGLAVTIAFMLLSSGGASFVPSIPRQFVTILVIVFSVVVGLGTVFYSAVYLYQRRTRQKQLAIQVLREKEKDFFHAIEIDIASLLK